MGYKPSKKAIVKRLQNISSAESISVDKNTINALVDDANGDLRFILTQMQMIGLCGKIQAIDYQKLAGASKFLHTNPFICAKSLLFPDVKLKNLSDKMELVFRDPDLIPLLVQENYLNHKSTNTKGNSLLLKVIVKAANSFSTGD